MQWNAETLHQSSHTVMDLLKEHVVNEISQQLNPDDTYNVYDWTANDDEKTVGTELSANQVGDSILQFLTQYDSAKMAILAKQLKTDEVFADISVMDEDDYQECDNGMIEMDKQFHHVEIKFSQVMQTLMQKSAIDKEDVSSFNQLNDEEQWIVLNCQATK